MSLMELQRRMAEDVRRPLTLDYHMQTTTESRASVPNLPASYVKPNATLASFERLEIYNRQYWFRVTAAVSEDFPALNAVLGSRRFDALIAAYLEVTPSSSWSLRDLGAGLPSFLAAHPELGGRRHRLGVDVARLEWAYVEAFDARQLTPITAEELAGLGPESRLLLQPHLQLLDVDYPVDDLVVAIRKDSPEKEAVSSAMTERRSRSRRFLPPMKQGRRYLAVHRFEDLVYYRPLPREEYMLLSALRNGTSISAAVESALAASSLGLHEQAEVIQQSFAHASELGWLCSLPDA